MGGDHDPEPHALLKRPLYVYDLPPELLFSLTLVGGQQQPSARGEVNEETDERATIHDHVVANSTSCTMCRVSFASVQEQRQHVKSDLHRYNLKLGMKALPPVDEATFVKLIGDLDESLSGSDSDESDDGAESDQHAGDTTLTALLRKQAQISQSTSDAEAASSKKNVVGNMPMVWMSSAKVGEDVGLGIYKAILTDDEQQRAATSLVDIIKKKQLRPTLAKSSGRLQANGTDPRGVDPHYFLCMLGGGHFAAMIVSLVPELRKGPGGSEERHAVVRAHKTFHRYTTRRKQGGSQSANDNAKGNAHSAGSSIRRYNELALEADVRSVLSEWRGMIADAELLFIRATGSTNRRTLFGPYDGQVLKSSDKRLRGFPFNTRRATQAELLRSFHELTRLKTGKLVEPNETKTVPSEQKASREAKAPATAPSLTQEDETAQFHTTQLQGLIRRSRAPAVLLYLSKNDLSPNFTLYPRAEHHHAPTPLHLSASTNSPALVLALLTKAGADPTLVNGEGKVAYDIAGDPKTRDAFRVARHLLGEAAVDWARSHVPAAMSQEEADARAQQEKAALDAAEARRRNAELEHIRQEEDRRNVGRIERKVGAGKSLSSVAEKTGADKREEEMRGLTPEMRMRLERERRARAAEERIKRMQGTR